LKRIRKANAEEVKGEAADDTSEEEDPDIAQFPKAFKSEEEFSRQALTDQMINNNNAASINPVRDTCFICLVLLPQSQVPEFNLSPPSTRVSHKILASLRNFCVLGPTSLM
jgi:hypothetical protein